MLETVSEPEPARGRKAEDTACAELLQRAAGSAVINADALTLPCAASHPSLLYLSDFTLGRVENAEIPRECFAFQRSWCTRDVVIH